MFGEIAPRRQSRHLTDNDHEPFEKIVQAIEDLEANFEDLDLDDLDENVEAKLATG